MMLDGIPISKRSQLVDLSEAKHLTTGAAEPETSQQSYEQVKISQEKFHERLSFGQGILLILSFGGALGVAWLGASQTGGSAPSLNETTVSLMPLLLASCGAMLTGRILTGSLSQQLDISQRRSWRSRCSRQSATGAARQC